MIRPHPFPRESAGRRRPEPDIQWAGKNHDRMGALRLGSFERDIVVVLRPDIDWDNGHCDFGGRVTKSVHLLAVRDIVEIGEDGDPGDPRRYLPQ